MGQGQSGLPGGFPGKDKKEDKVYAYSLLFFYKIFFFIVSKLTFYRTKPRKSGNLHFLLV